MTAKGDDRCPIGSAGPSTGSHLNGGRVTWRASGRSTPRAPEAASRRPGGVSHDQYGADSPKLVDPRDLYLVLQAATSPARVEAALLRSESWPVCT
jgi:hypothetical protein